MDAVEGDPAEDRAKHARDRARHAKQREMEAHRRAIKTHEAAAAQFTKLGDSKGADAARTRARETRERLQLAEREQVRDRAAREAATGVSEGPVPEPGEPPRDEPGH